MKKFAIVLLVAATALGGCRRSGAVAVPLAASVQRPSNVAFLVDVSNGGEPVPGLSATAFRLSEDGAALDASAARLTLLDADLASDTGTLLLVDVSAKTEERGASLAQAVDGFVRTVRQSQPVWVYVFDGNEEIFEIASFEVSPEAEPAPGEESAKPDTAAVAAPKESTKPGKDEAASGETPKMAPELEALAQATTTEGSRNLNGAVVRALEKLDERLAASTKPVRVGSLVVVVSGRDTASRVSESELEAALGTTRHAVYVIGSEEAPLRDFRDAAVFETEPGQLEETRLGAVADRVVAARGSRYLLSYCSPGRRGLKVVTVEVELGGGGRSTTASFDAEFFADGFADDCKPEDPPRFVVTMAYGPNGPAPMATAESPAAPSSDAVTPKPASRSARKPARRRGRRQAPASAPKAAPTPAPKSAPPDGFEP